MNERYKVLYITNYDTMYGANKALYELMCSLQEKYNVDPYLLVPGKEGGIIGRLCTERGMHVLDYDFRISALSVCTEHKQFRKFTRRVMRYTDYFRILHQLKKAQLHFDLVHSNSSIFDIGYFFSRVWKIPHVWHIREFGKKDYGLEMVLNDRRFGKELSKSESVVAISDSIYSYIKKYSDGIPLKKIYDGIFIPEPYRKVHIKDGIVAVCIVGSSNSGKNTVDVVKACSAVLERKISNFCLYIVGDYENSECYREIESFLVQNEKLRKHIVFTGYCDKIHDFLKDMDIGVMASDSEAFGRVTVEYMANYMAVLGTDTGATPEIIGYREDLFAPHDIKRLSLLLEKYITDPECIKTAGERNRISSEQFTADKNVLEIYKIYKRLLNKAV